MRYEMRDLKTGRVVQATRQQRKLLLKIGRAEDVEAAEPDIEVTTEPDPQPEDESPKPVKKAAKKSAKKRTYKRRDMQAEEE